MTAVLAATSSAALHSLQAFPPGRAPQPNSSPSHRQLHFESNDQAVSVPRRKSRKRLEGKSRVFFLDVNPLCYRGSQPSLLTFANWLSLFFSEVSLRDPIIAVFDGNDCNEYRRQLLPSYKAHRRKIVGHWPELQRHSRTNMSSGELQVTDLLRKCNVPVIKVDGFEADDTVATLTDQVVQRGHQVVIGSPDKDFKQLISEDVQMVMPMPERRRWSFYTLMHYIEQYKCHPSSDLSLRNPDHYILPSFKCIRTLLKHSVHDHPYLEMSMLGCIIGDEVDGVPGIQHLAPGFVRKTALKLLKKHGCLVSLLGAAAVRTVGKHYAQDALTKHADFLRRNFEVLSLRRHLIPQSQNLHFFNLKQSFFLAPTGMLMFILRRNGCWRETLAMILIPCQALSMY